MKPKEKSDVVNNGAPIKVRFPSVREKIKVLQACRNATKSLQDKGITTIEDFTEKVRIQHHPGPGEQFCIWLGPVTTKQSMAPLLISKTPQLDTEKLIRKL